MNDDSTQVPADFQAFMDGTARTIAEEECRRITNEAFEDLKEMMSVWATKVTERIATRLEEARLLANFDVTIEWQPAPPKFFVTGQFLREEEENPDGN